MINTKLIPTSHIFSHIITIFQYKYQIFGVFREMYSHTTTDYIICGHTP